MFQIHTHLHKKDNCLCFNEEFLYVCHNDKPPHVKRAISHAKILHVQQITKAHDELNIHSMQYYFSIAFQTMDSQP